MENFERSGVRRRTAIEMPADALGGKRNGRQRVLDFVGDPPRHFTPGGLLLGLE